MSETQTPRICPRFRAALLACGHEFHWNDAQCIGEQCAQWVKKEYYEHSTEGGEVLIVAEGCSDYFVGFKAA